MELFDAIEALKRYRDDGCPLGDFLTAVVSNDLMQAFGRADMTSRENLFEICQWVYNNMPMTICGSREKVKAWIDKKIEERKNHGKPDMKRCGAGMGKECCIFLTVGAEGLDCERGGPLDLTLRSRAPRMTAQRIPTDPWPHCMFDEEKQDGS